MSKKSKLFEKGSIKIYELREGGILNYCSKEEKSVKNDYKTHISHFSSEGTSKHNQILGGYTSLEKLNQDKEKD